jgi:hypothetical protein
VLRLAHLSDLHYTTARRSHIRATLEAVRRGGAEHLVITGDLTDDGSDVQMRGLFALLNETGWPVESMMGSNSLPNRFSSLAAHERSVGGACCSTVGLGELLRDSANACAVWEAPSCIASALLSVLCGVVCRPCRLYCAARPFHVERTRASDADFDRDHIQIETPAATSAAQAASLRSIAVAYSAHKPRSDEGKMTSLKWNLLSACRIRKRVALSLFRIVLRRRSEWPDASAANTLFI